MMFMDAYSVLNSKDKSQQIDETSFYDLISEFRSSYFTQIDYHNRLSKHKKPVQFLNELLQGKFGNNGLYSYLLKIQGREEMRDNDPENSSSGYVNVKIQDILEEDKNVKTL